ncbi:Short-chain dehydrogenase/reductase SDR protein [Dioscorea alata]|uniref:Short-chain dehydrogenase/reductase SDR protein n=1 Tax=Dioscorea alata TaxID=55571 RepID=A0ACB7V3W6_DIOAL|nr:Short-chain dehydrogenase/reductase SDR protein [Dioscorea alata]
MEDCQKKSISPVTSLDRRWSLNGATALVTGGTKGIGHAIVEELAKFGASVYTCSRNEAELAECLKQWEDKKFKVTGSVCDVSSKAERENLMENVSTVFQGKLDIFIHNVGTAIMKPTVECTDEDYSFMMATNFESALHLSQLAHPLLKASASGSLVFISSTATYLVYEGLAIYSASKGITGKPIFSSSFESHIWILIVFHLKRSNESTDQAFSMRVGERKYQSQLHWTFSH